MQNLTIKDCVFVVGGESPCTCVGDKMKRLWEDYLNDIMDCHVACCGKSEGKHFFWNYREMTLCHPESFMI